MKWVMPGVDRRNGGHSWSRYAVKIRRLRGDAHRRVVLIAGPTSAKNSPVVISTERSLAWAPVSNTSTFHPQRNGGTEPANQNTPQVPSNRVNERQNDCGIHAPHVSFFSVKPLAPQQASHRTKLLLENGSFHQEPFKFRRFFSGQSVDAPNSRTCKLSRTFKQNVPTG